MIPPLVFAERMRRQCQEWPTSAGKGGPQRGRADRSEEGRTAVRKGGGEEGVEARTMQVFEATLSADAEIRTRAEHLLAQVSNQPTFDDDVLAELQRTQPTDHAPTHQTIAATRLAAATYLRRRWQTRRHAPHLPPRLLPALLCAEPLVAQQLALILPTLPQHHAMLVFPVVMRFVSGPESSSRCNALRALHALVSSETTHHTPVSLQLPQILPDLLPVTRGCIEALHHAPQSHLVRVCQQLVLVIRVLVCLMRPKHPATCVQHPSATVADWLHLLDAVLSYPLTRLSQICPRPSEHHPRSDRARHETLRSATASLSDAKLDAAAFVLDLFRHFANPTLPQSLFADDASAAEGDGAQRVEEQNALVRFGDNLRREHAPRMTIVMMQLLSSPPDTLPAPLAHVALRFLEAAVSLGLAFKAMRPHLPQVLTDIIFPYLSLTHHDLRLWTDDAPEFVRRTYDLADDDDVSPRMAACSLLRRLVQQRRSLVITPLMNLLLGVLDTFATTAAIPTTDAPPDADVRAHRLALACRKDGALLAIGAIRDYLTPDREAVRHLEHLLVAHVAPDFSSDIPFLRARACWLFGQFTAVERISPEIVVSGLAGVEACLHDEHLPVRMRAAIDIRHFLRYAIARDRITPGVPQLLQLLFSLLGDMDSADIVATIDETVRGFADAVAPFASQLCTRLVEMFLRASEDSQTDAETVFAAAQCVQAMLSVVECVGVSAAGAKEMWRMNEIEESLKPVFEQMFEKRRSEFFEESLELLATVVSQSWNMDRRCGDGDGMKQYLWEVFPRAMDAFYSWAVDYSVHYLQVLEAYMCRSAEEFTVRGYPKHIVGMVEKLWENRMTEEDVAQGERIISLYLRHCIMERDEIEGQEATMRSLASLLAKSVRESHEATRTRLLRALSHVTYLSPHTAAAEIAKAGVLPAWMHTWKEGSLPSYDCKASGLALTALLSVGDKTPSAIRAMQREIITRAQKPLLTATQHTTDTRERGLLLDDVDGRAALRRACDGCAWGVIRIPHQN